MKITLCAVDPELAEAWKRSCGDLNFVEVYQGSILELSCDAAVSPANSFGFMDGGLDMLYTCQFGWHVQDRLQSLIRDKHHGELLVGRAEIVATDHPRIAYVIAAPTMRVPMILSDSVNPYLAARAALLLIKHGRFADGSRKGEAVSRVVNHVAIPGLGTGVGQVEPGTCARQVRAAIDEVVLGKYEFPKSWREAQRRHQHLYTGGPNNLHYE